MSLKGVLINKHLLGAKACVMKTLLISQTEMLMWLRLYIVTSKPILIIFCIILMIILCSLLRYRYLKITKSINWTHFERSGHIYLLWIISRGSERNTEALYKCVCVYIYIYIYICAAIFSIEESATHFVLFSHEQQKHCHVGDCSRESFSFTKKEGSAWGSIQDFCGYKFSLYQFCWLQPVNCHGEVRSCNGQFCFLILNANQLSNSVLVFLFSGFLFCFFIMKIYFETDFLTYTWTGSWEIL